MGDVGSFFEALDDEIFFGDLKRNKRELLNALKGHGIESDRVVINGYWAVFDIGDKRWIEMMATYLDASRVRVKIHLLPSPRLVEILKKPLYQRTAEERVEWTRYGMTFADAIISGKSAKETMGKLFQLIDLVD